MSYRIYKLQNIYDKERISCRKQKEYKTEMAVKNKNYIKIRGACEHNLKNVYLDIPRNEL